MSASVTSRSMSDPPSNGIPSRKATMLGQRRKDNAILQDKLPSLMRQPLPLPPHQHQASAAQMESEAMRDALWKRLQLKNLIIAAVAEFLGTFLFLFFALAIATRAGDAIGSDSLSAQLFSSLGFGFSLCISAWVFFRISGGVQNPAITLALTLTGAMDWTKCIILTIVQFLAGIAAAGLVSGLLPGSVNARTILSTDLSVVQGFFLEFFLTCQLIFTVLMLAAEKHKATFLAPVGIGLALFITQLLGQSYTGACVNPARSLGPDAVVGQFNSYSWIYYIAPYCAAIVTAGFYWLLKWARYETTSPDQDADEHRAGQFRQVILDGSGNVVGTVETVDASEYNQVDDNNPNEPAEEVESQYHDTHAMQQTSEQTLYPSHPITYRTC